jgi:hypothetical protein
LEFTPYDAVPRVAHPGVSNNSVYESNAEEKARKLAMAGLYVFVIE